MCCVSSSQSVSQSVAVIIRKNGIWSGRCQQPARVVKSRRADMMLASEKLKNPDDDPSPPPPLSLSLSLSLSLLAAESRRIKNPFSILMPVN